MPKFREFPGGMALTYLFRVQTGLVALAMVVALVIGGFAAAGAVLYGGVTAIVNSLLLARGLQRAGKAAEANPKWSGVLLLSGMLQRFMLVAVLLGLGFGWLHLHPLPLLAGFIIVQISFGLSPWVKSDKNF